jgi:hypothetical protein
MLPNRSPNCRSFRDGARPPRETEISQGDREIGSHASPDFWARAAASESDSARVEQQASCLLPRNIFGFGPPKTKMRSSLARLPIFRSPCEISEVFETSCQHDSSPKRPHVMARRRHGSFCKRAATWQPQDLINLQRAGDLRGLRKRPANAIRIARWWTANVLCKSALPPAARASLGGALKEGFRFAIELLMCSQVGR